MLRTTTPEQFLAPLLLLLNRFLYSTVIIVEFGQINAGWAWGTKVSDSEFAATVINILSYGPMGWGNLLDYKF